ncbi:sigma-70 family RNA polymerase sigma factor [Rhizobacter sp. AJA081-3]|uniref:sigma-70 family RNA polymerase sigma factor n=1 Tax=Rhizobacter sp. AJA081-3 TaxID=2753607 RepID=UPI001ADFB3C1|nr:sigma-70 family RNA polymerase sigma factor [Rhizobacter sp. AJA081-3]QTN21784.1 sigma-70 family RNA polymerase sigma factor [Rhizobacter sp. AJA081-3]
MAETERLLNRPLGRLLKVAVSAGIESAVRLHISRGDDLEGRDEAGLTPLLIAAARNRGSICRMLLEAGANPSAIDPVGRDALSTAVAHGSAEAVAAIQEHLVRAGQVPVRASDPALAGHEARDSAGKPVGADSGRADGAAHLAGQGNFSFVETTPKEAEPHSTSPEGAPLEPEPKQVAVFREHSGNLPNEEVVLSEPDLGDWEPVDAPDPPPDNPELTRAEADRQRRINAHAPIDRGASWDSFDAILPELARPLARSEDVAFLQTLRDLLLRALREGSVPKVAIEDALSERGDGENRDEQAEAAFEFIVGDLGADVDERLEFHSSCPSENFEVPIVGHESEGEEAEIDSALLHFEQMRSGGNDPVRLYYRSASSHALLTADQEVALAKSMDVAIGQALDALAGWPEGIRYLLQAFEQARADAVALGKIVVTAAAAPDAGVSMQTDAPADGEFEEGVAEQVEGGEIDGGDADPEAAMLGDELPGDDPTEVFERIAELADGTSSPQVVSTLREQLARLRFRRTFLISIADVPADGRDAAARPYRRAITELLRHRSRMAEANLRLVIDMARKQLHSGAAIEDLIQDGNIGLLSAVDRFDWRRGFRFSTMATWWIRQSLTRGVADKLFAIRLPVHIRERVSRGRWEAEKLERKRGSQLSIAEQAALCGLSIRRFETAARAFSEPLSMEQAELDGLLDSPSDDPFDLVFAKERVGVLNSVLSRFKRKDSEVVRMRYGIGVPEAMTLEQIGQILDVTRERVRQLEAKSLKTLTAKPRREAIAAALGLPVEADQSAQVEGRQVFGEHDLIGDSQEPTATLQLPNGSGTAGAVDDVEEPGASQGDVGAMEQLVARAWKLGVPVSVKGEGAGKRYVFGIFKADTGKKRNLIRCLVELGYTLRAGEGYSK